MPSADRYRREKEARAARAKHAIEKAITPDTPRAIEEGPEPTLVRCPDCGEVFVQTFPGTPFERCGRKPA
jgi:hypothetical protein